MLPYTTSHFYSDTNQSSKGRYHLPVALSVIPETTAKAEATKTLTNAEIFMINIQWVSEFVNY